MSEHANRLQDTENVTQTSLDVLSAPLVIPASKLDADQYAAEDIDGVTESLFGSGNMNFLSLQAGQTDIALALREDADITQGDSPIGGKAAAGMDKPLDTAEDAGGGAGATGGEGQYTGATVGSVSASQLSSDAGAFNDSLNTGSVFQSYSGGDGGDASSLSVRSGTHPSLRNSENSTEQTVNNVSNVDNSSSTTLIGGDIVEDIVNLGDEIIQNVLEGDIEDITNLVTNQISDITETVTNLLDNDTINEITRNVNSIVGDTITNVTDLLGENGLSLALDDTLLGTLDTQLAISLNDSVSGILDTGIVSETLLGTLESLTGLGGFLSPDSGAIITFDLFNGAGGGEGDTDLTFSGINLPEVTWDALENLVGDIDVEVSIPELPGSLEEVAGTVQGLVDGLGGLQLGDPGALDIGGLGNDGLLTADILGNDISQELDATVNDLTGGLPDDLIPGELPVEEVTDAVNDTLDQLDGALESAGGIVDALPGVGGEDGLGGVLEDVGGIADGLDGIDDALEDADGIVDALPGVGGEDGLLSDPADMLLDTIDALAGDVVEDTGGWTEDLSGSGLFDDIIDGLSTGDVLPDPVGTIAEGLGVLDIDPGLDVGGLGGLFG